MVITKSLRFLIIVSNIAFPFVSSIGHKLVLPNYFVLPICLFQCDTVMRVASCVMLAAWTFLWTVLFQKNANVLLILLSKIIVLVQVLLLFYDAIEVKGIYFFSSYLLLPNYIIFFCYIRFAIEFYKLFFINKIQNTK